MIIIHESQIKLIRIIFLLLHEIMITRPRHWRKPAKKSFPPTNPLKRNRHPNTAKVKHDAKKLKNRRRFTTSRRFVRRQWIAERGHRKKPSPLTAKPLLVFCRIAFWPIRTNRGMGLSMVFPAFPHSMPFPASSASRVQSANLAVKHRP